MDKLKCSNCGKTIETLPQHCGQDMVYNEKTEQMECYMGAQCGYLALDKLLCAKCQKNC